jgi:regulator of protease activity HflC (stomatin/prohibitin superfamily)
MVQYKEKELSGIDGGLAILILFLIAGLLVFIQPSVVFLVPIAFIFAIFCKGFYIVNPNEAVVATFFGKYVGTQKNSGFFWTNPLNGKDRISVKIQNLNTPCIKVNDKNGNPIEIAAIFVWQIEDTARAFFAVEDYIGFLRNQAESALRKIASEYSYDAEHDVSLKANSEEISKRLKETLLKLVAVSGIDILDAKLTNLSYSVEIAQAMLKKQQAQAIVAARQKIVEGALDMVENLLEEIEERKMVEFSNEDKVKLTTSLMVVLTSENAVAPVIQVSDQK